MDPYWLTNTGDELAEAMLDRIKAYYRVLDESGRLELWRRSIRMYRGLDPDGGWSKSSAVSFGGEQGELVMLRINHYRSLIQHIHTLITGSRPAVRARAGGDDRQSLEEALLAEQILESDMHNGNLSHALQRAALFALQWTEGWVYQGWDVMRGRPYAADPETGRITYEGGIVTIPMRPIDVVRDVAAVVEGDQTFDWLIVRRPRNRYDLLAQYSERAEDIDALPSVQETDTTQALFGPNPQQRAETDRVYTFELYADRSPALPNGKWAVLAGDVILDEGPLPYSEIPVFELWPDAEEGAAFGHSPTIDLLAPQEAYDSCVSVAATNHDAFGVQCLWAKKGDHVDTEAIAKGLRVIQTEEPPVPMQFTRTAEDTYRLMELYKREMETISGINSVARGDPDTSLKSGAALALVHSMSVQFLSAYHGQYARLIERTCGARIDLHKKFTKVSKTLEVVGSDDRAAVVEWTGQSISSVSKVVVEIANPLMQTSQGRMEIADRYVANGWVQTPEQYSMVLATGRAEPLFRRDRDELRMIRAENERMKTGKPVTAFVTDRHTIHIREHSVELSNPDVRFNEQLAAPIVQHIQEHIDMGQGVNPYILMAIGEPVPEGPPPGPDGGGGGGGPPPKGMPMDGSPLSQAANGPGGMTGIDALQANGGTFGGSAKMPQMPTNPLTGEPA